MSGDRQNVEFCWKPNPALDNARDWIEKHKFVDDGGAFPKIDSFLNNYKNNPRETVVKIVQELEGKRNMASAILELCGFNPDDSIKAIQTLIDDLRFYSEDHWPYFNDENFVSIQASVEFWNASIDIPIIGRILGPAMRLGSKLSFTRADEKSSIFWTYLATILADCGVPLVSAPFPAVLEYYPPINFACGGKFIDSDSDIKSPMIVFENADIFAAVKSVIRRVWEFNGKTYWAPTHVYVQESQFKLFVSLLTTDAINHLELLRVDVIRREAKATDGHPPILEPCDRSFFKFFLGWDPKTLDVEKDVGKGVIVLPFRTVDEGIKAANSLSNCFCASVWTEKSKFGSEAAAVLKMNTVWINCHGVLEPHTSFARDSHLVPVNGPDLIEMLMAITKPKVVREIKEAKTTAVISLKKFVVNDAEALKIVKSPASLTDFERNSLLRPLQNYIFSIDPSLDLVPFTKFGYLVTESSIQITSSCLASSPQQISCLTNSPIAVASVLFLTHYFILRGCGLIVRVPSPVFLETFERHPPLLDLCSKGFIVFVVHTGGIDSFNLIKNRRAIVLFQGKESGKEGIEEGIDLCADNLALLPHFPHLFTLTKNVYLM